MSSTATESTDVDCPTCGRAFSSENGMKVHHVQVHDESLAGVDVECEHCGETFSVKEYRTETARFCSAECRTDHLSGENHPNANKVDLVCEQCGDSFTAPSSHADRRRHCSAECALKTRASEHSGDGNPNYRGGYEGDYGPNWEVQRRKAIRRDFGRCRLCGCTRVEHIDRFGSDLHVHHRTPYREFDDYERANVIHNLLTLCIECHNQLEHAWY